MSFFLFILFFPNRDDTMSHEEPLERHMMLAELVMLRDKGKDTRPVPKLTPIQKYMSEHLLCGGLIASVPMVKELGEYDDMDTPQAQKHLLLYAKVCVLITGVPLEGYSRPCGREDCWAECTTHTKKCASCKVVPFCSDGCYILAWREHRDNCLSFRNITKDYATKPMPMEKWGEEECT